MQTPSIRTILATALAAPALLFWAAPAANSQSPAPSAAPTPSMAPLRANPSFQPVGTSASGNTSTAWFHDPSTGRAIACQTVQSAGAGLAGIQCVAAKLPQETP